jgi:EmrB/QacA subfamily drug resistance transporter
MPTAMRNSSQLACAAPNATKGLPMLDRCRRLGPVLQVGPMTARPAVSRWAALALLCSAQFMVMLDGAIVNIALPSIQRDLHFSASSIQWVFSAYLLTYGGLLLLGGRTADLLGRRRMFTAGATLLGAASLLAGLSATQGELIAARAAMGVGAAVITPAALSIILRLFSDGDERNRALGIWGAIIGLGACAGVLLGGVITQGPGWQWVFYINVPIAAAVVALGRVVLPESRVESAGHQVDVAGGLSITVGLVLVVYGIVRAPDLGWGSAQTILVLGGGLVLIAAFVMIELRTRAPLLPLALFRTATLSAANAVAFLFTGAFTATIFLMTLYMQRALGYSAIKAGFAYLPLTVGLIVTSTIAAHLVTRCGVKLVLTVGVVVTGAGLAVLSQASASSSFVTTLLPGFLLAAAGMGATMVPLSIAAFAGVGDSGLGAASGVFNTAQQIGGAFGVAALSTVAYSHIRGASAAELQHGVPAVLGNAYAEAFAAGLVFVGAALVIALFAIRQREVSAWRCATLYRVSTPAGAEPATAPV